MELALFIVSALLIISVVYIFAKRNTHERVVDAYKEELEKSEKRCIDKYYLVHNENRKLKAELETLKNKQNGK